MNKLPVRFSHVVSTVALATILAACGGGSGGSSNTTPTTPPPTAKDVTFTLQGEALAAVPAAMYTTRVPVTCVMQGQLCARPLTVTSLTTTSSVPLTAVHYTYRGVPLTGVTNRGPAGEYIFVPDPDSLLTIREPGDIERHVVLPITAVGGATSVLGMSVTTAGVATHEVVGTAPNLTVVTSAGQVTYATQQSFMKDGNVIGYYDAWCPNKIAECAWQINFKLASTTSVPVAARITVAVGSPTASPFWEVTTGAFTSGVFQEYSVSGKIRFAGGRTVRIYFLADGPLMMGTLILTKLELSRFSDGLVVPVMSTMNASDSPCTAITGNVTAACKG